METSFAGTKTLNNKIIHLMLSEKVLSPKELIPDKKKIPQDYF